MATGLQQLDEDDETPSPVRRSQTNGGSSHQPSPLPCSEERNPRGLLMAAGTFLTLSVAMGGLLYGGGGPLVANVANPAATAVAAPPPPAGDGGAVSTLAAPAVPAAVTAVAAAAAALALATAASADCDGDACTLPGFVPVPQMRDPFFARRGRVPFPLSSEGGMARQGSGSGNSNNSDRGRRALGGVGGGGGGGEAAGVPMSGVGGTVEHVFAEQALETEEEEEEAAAVAAAAVAAAVVAVEAVVGGGAVVKDGSSSSNESGGDGGGNGGGSGGENRDGYPATKLDGEYHHHLHHHRHRHATPLATTTLATTVSATLTGRRHEEGGGDGGGGGGGRSPLVVDRDMLYSSAVAIGEEDLIDDIDEDVFEDDFDDGLDVFQDVFGDAFFHVFEENFADNFDGDEDSPPPPLPSSAPELSPRQRERRRLMAAAATARNERGGDDVNFMSEDDARMYRFFFQSHRALASALEPVSEAAALAEVAAAKNKEKEDSEGTNIYVPPVSFEKRSSAGGATATTSTPQLSMGVLKSPAASPFLTAPSAPAVASKHDDLEQNQRGGDGSGEEKEGKGRGRVAKMCSPLEVVGLSDCPELEASIDKILAAKAEMLRQVIRVLSDPASAGTGGNPDEPLLLVQKLAVDEADAVFGAFDGRFIKRVSDAGAWSPLPGGFNRWAERYHRKILRKSRPVLIAVHGDDVCALEHELSLEARMEAAGVTQARVGDIASQATGRRMPGFGEEFDVPVVLMTLGWDPAGDPTHHERALGRDRECALRVLKMPRVVRWFTSHTRYDSHTDEKFRYLPIGFGGFETRNGLPQTAYIDAAKQQLEILETCPTGQAGRFDLLFQCNTLERDPRGAIWRQMTEKTKGPFPVNRAPLGAVDMVLATARGLFAVSPPGTGPDCFRHYEMMLEGNIVMVPDVHSLRKVMKGLPVFFFGGKEAAWGGLTCRRLSEMAETIQKVIQGGKEGVSVGGGGGEGGRGWQAGGYEGGLQYEKLTHAFWRKYVRRETLRAGGADATDESAPYVERSVIPLNPLGWTTFREIGCFSRNRRYRRRASKTTEVKLPGDRRTPKECAALCSFKMGGGVGFFGISDGDRCWCDKSPGETLPAEHCDTDCHGEEEGGGGCGGAHASTAFVFGPEETGSPFEYLGCFPSSSHVMYHAEVRLRDSNTPFICEAFCTSLRYPYFALESSDLCRCGVIPSNTPRSVRAPAYIHGGGYEPDPGPPNATFAGEPMPEGVRVGDPRFECRKGRCSGDGSLWGCGTDHAFDLYKNVDPCSLFRECGQ